MTKNLYYGQRNCERNETIRIVKRFIIRKLENLIKVATAILVFATVIALYRGEKVLKMTEERESLYNENHPYLEQFFERITVEQMVWDYIHSLELPKDEINQMHTTNTEIMIVEQELEGEKVSKGISVECTQSDVEMLAQLMYAEEGVFFKKYYETPEEIEKVHKLAGSVVIHRAENNYMGYSTIEETIFAKGQYAQQTLERIQKGQEIPNIVYTWAEELLTEGALGPKGLIYQAEFQQGDDTYERIGNQYFCIEKNYN